MWKAAAASVIGSSHVASGEECQDSSALTSCDQEGWLAACVSDGAGTARLAKQGSQIASSMFVREMSSVATKVDGKGVGEWLVDEIIQVVLRIRDTLRQRQDSTLADYNCTLVGCLIGPSGGVLVHLGDGLAVGGEFARSKGDDLTANAWTNVTLSEPRNGEYSNETFFITEGRWLTNLRITPVGPLDWLMLCSDGGMALAFDGIKPKPRFLAPLLTECARAEGNEKLESVLISVLENERANLVTDDDKSLIVIVRERSAEECSDIVIENFDTTTGAQSTKTASGGKPLAQGATQSNAPSPADFQVTHSSSLQSVERWDERRLSRRLKWVVGITLGVILALIVVAVLVSKTNQGAKFVRWLTNEKPLVTDESAKPKRLSPPPAPQAPEEPPEPERDKGNGHKSSQGQEK